MPGPVYYMNEGNDTLLGAASVFAMTVVGGNDSLDGHDDLFTGAGNDLVFGNGGNDEINAGDGANTVVAGYGTDNVLGGGAGDLIFGNESNEPSTAAAVRAATRCSPAWATTRCSPAAAATPSRQRRQRHAARLSQVDTISGGSGSDLFVYRQAEEDGDDVVGGWSSSSPT